MGFNESGVQRPERNQAVELSGVLFCFSKPELDVVSFETELGLRIEGVLVEASTEDSFIFRFPAYAPYNGRDQKTPFFVLKPLDHSPAIPIVDSWASPDLTFSRQLAAQCKQWFSLEMHDSLGLDHMNRIDLFNQCLESVLRVIHPALCYFPHCDALMATPDLLDGLGGADPHLLIAMVSLGKDPIHEGSHFRTVGLFSLGLSDFRFSGECVLSLEDQAELLWNYAYSAYQNGDVYRDGSYILGPDGPQSFVCERSRPGGEGTAVMISVLCNSNK
jgi:hypothetical protein